MAGNEVLQRFELPAFRPVGLLRGGSAQTLVGNLLPSLRDGRPIAIHQIPLEDGDRLVAMEYRPAGWREHQRTALLVHGLNGSYRSGYMTRVGGRLLRGGIRVIRLNMRGCGPGFGLARGFNHAGRSGDVRAVLRWLHERDPASPVTAVGFSLGGNAVLKMAGEDHARPPGNLDSLVAVSAPVDLAASCRHLSRPGNGFYDWYFTRECIGVVRRLQRQFPDIPPVRFPPRLSLFGFDEHFTAPYSGFRDALDYYARCSAAPLIPRIAVPGLILSARDDPVVECRSLEELERPSKLEFLLTRHGGHMGYLGATGEPFGLRWMDALVSRWVMRR